MPEKKLVSFDAFNGLPEMYFLLSDKEEILEYNSAVAAVFDNKKSVIKGKKFEEIIHPQYIQKVGNNFNKSISSGKMTEIEVKLKVPSKKELDVRLLFSPFISGKAKQVLVIGKDITIEKRKEIDLLRFYYVAQNTVNPLQITDINGKMIYVNPAFEMASGYSKDELLGQNPSIFSSKRHSQKFWDKMWETISAGKVWVGDVENKKKNGDTFYTQLLISPILDNNKNVIGYFGIHRDLTEKRNLEKQLIHTQKMESIGTLAAGIAHEVGNPLASISALVQIVQRSTEDIFINDKLELVKKQINRISKIIRDLVDFSRPSNYELKSIDINENLMEAIEIVRVGKKAKNIVFISKLDENIGKLPLIGDQVQQVFVNILINAVDAIIERQQTEQIEGKIMIETSCIEDNLLVSFADNGIGMPEDISQKIFEPFYTSKKEGKGTGLGLWVSYGIIKSSQGDIKAESKLNRGTTFTISLPIHPNY